MQIQGTAAIVTGGASGLGEATAIRLAAAGARVTIFDVQADKARQLAERIGGRAAVCDVTNPEQVETALREAREAHGVARLVINCAGGGAPRRVVGKQGVMPLEDFLRVVQLNLVGSFNVARLAAADMMSVEAEGEERGLILFTASVAAFEGQIGQAAYAASKGGLVALTIQLAREFASQAIRVMAIAPGIFETPIMANASPELIQSLADAIPFPARLGQPPEFAELVASIATNPYLNGEVIRLDGAVRLAPR